MCASAHARSWRRLHGIAPGAPPAQSSPPSLGTRPVLGCRAGVKVGTEGWEEKSSREAPEAPQPGPELSAGPRTAGRSRGSPGPPRDHSPRRLAEGTLGSGGGRRRVPHARKDPQTPGVPPAPTPPRGRGEEQVTSPETPGRPRQRRQPRGVTRARQWPGGLRGDAGGPRCAAAARPPRVRTAERGGDQAPARWPTCRADRRTARARHTGGDSERAPGAEGRPLPRPPRAAPRRPCRDPDREGRRPRGTDLPRGG